MRVAQVKLHQVMAVEELTFDVGPPGTITVIEGGNETGKTSTLEGIRAVLRGGATADLLRHGAERGEAVLVFDDDVVAEQGIGPGGDLVVRHPKFGAIKRPRGYLNALVGALNANPLDFVQDGAEGRKLRVERLMEAMPLRVSKAEVDEAVGRLNVGAVNEAEHALAELDRIAERIYEVRTNLNAEAKAKATLIEQLQSSLPAGGVVDRSDEARTLEQRRTALVQDTAAAETSIRHDYDARIEAVRAGANAQGLALQRKIDELLAAQAKVVADAEREMEALRHERRDKVAEVHAAMTAAMGEISVELATITEHNKAVAAAENTRRIIADAEAQHADAEAKVERCTAALRGIAELKAKKVNEGAIPGIEIRDTGRKGEREVFYNDTVWTRLNTAKKYELAVEIAAMSAGDLPFMCIDGVEALDAESFRALAAAVKRRGVQLITARTTAERDPLRVAVVETTTAE
jgi:hypothetical protein